MVLTRNHRQGGGGERAALYRKMLGEIGPGRYERCEQGGDFAVQLPADICMPQLKSESPEDAAERLIDFVFEGLADNYDR